MGKSTTQAKPQGHAEPAPGADNNTRLAFLESRVEPLITATANIAARYGGSVELAPLDANEDLVDCQIRVLNAIAALPENADATPGEIAAIARADAAEAALKASGEALDEANRQIAELEQKLADAGDVIEVEEAAEPIERTADNARGCGPDEPVVDRSDLAEMMGSGQHFELVFGDGAKEIIAFEPTRIAAGEFRRLANGRYLVMPAIVVKAGATGEQIHGASLFVNGEHAAYCPLERALQVKPGDTRQFVGHLAF